MTTAQAGIHSTPQTAKVATEAVILDVGHGNCAVLRDGSKCVIVDAKSDKLLYQELVASGVRRIEHLVLSHADSDHIAGALRLLPNEDFEVGTVWVNSDSQKDSQQWHELLALLTALHQAGRLKARLAICDLDGWDLSLENVLIDVIHPTLTDIGHGTGKRGRVRPEITTNGMSVVLRVLLEGLPALLLPGDLDSAGLDQILSRDKEVSAHVLVYPHHGGHSGGGPEESFAKILCDAVSPDVVLFSMGRGVFRNPLPEVVGEITRSFPDTRVACTQLSENCHAGTVPEGERGYLLNRPAAGNTGNRSCAGTVRVAVADNRLVVEPAPLDHQRWIRQHVSAAMCESGGTLPVPRPRNP
ncbi:ComEC/Rec2 family competence protein [Streptomyces sp. NPDC093591]|uniref:ComEC/Rec2 family competence protein n=1 Tax=Streptomyces sp. NPDC093591 TaxID=3366044 RepID=UPI0037F40288